MPSRVFAGRGCSPWKDPGPTWQGGWQPVARAALCGWEYVGGVWVGMTLAPCLAADRAGTEGGITRNELGYSGICFEFKHCRP